MDFSEHVWWQTIVFGLLLGFGFAMGEFLFHTVVQVIVRKKIGAGV